MSFLFFGFVKKVSFSFFRSCQKNVFLFVFFVLSKMMFCFFCFVKTLVFCFFSFCRCNDSLLFVLLTYWFPDIMWRVLLWQPEKNRNTYSLWQCVLSMATCFRLCVHAQLPSLRGPSSTPVMVALCTIGERYYLLSRTVPPWMTTGLRTQWERVHSQPCWGWARDDADFLSKQTNGSEVTLSISKIRLFHIVRTLQRLATDLNTRPDEQIESNTST